VSRRWIDIASDRDFIPVHGMEKYEHPFGVSTEFRSAWRVTTTEEDYAIQQYHAAARA
jgi:hypothetical protein